MRKELKKPSDLHRFFWTRSRLWGGGGIIGKEITIGQTITNDVCDSLFYIFPLKSFQAKSITLNYLFEVV